MDDLKELRSTIEQKKGHRNRIQRDLGHRRREVKRLERKRDRHEKALETLKRVSLLVQKELQIHISDITSTALGAVFDDPYNLEVEFVERRNKTECDIYFVNERGTRIDPLDGGEGGAADVAAFALRVASWSMQTPNTRPILVLDEPFKHLKGEAENQRMLEMLKQLNQELGLQIIMVSDERVAHSDTKEVADRLFRVRRVNSITQITKEK